MEKSGRKKSAVRVTSNKTEKLDLISIQNGPDNELRLPKVILNPSNGYSIPKLKSMNMKDNQAPIKHRPLKLVYDHDIRLAEMPVNSSFKILRAVVGKLFPMLKAVLIKYKDSDGDLVTITCSSELRLAESSVDNDSNIISKKRDSTFSMLRLHIIEVNPEQEPPLLEDQDEDEPECEMDDWLFDFAQIFMTHSGIDPNSHIDLDKVGKELLSKALMETVNSEEAHIPFDRAISKFDEVAALAFFNLGNVHMCEAQKRMPIDEAGPKETMDEQFKNAYDCVREKYKKAKRKYKMALLIKPDFFEGLFALAQQQFEMAKLLWSFVLAKKSDLSKWDPTKMILLFDSAETNIRAATTMLEKMEEQRTNESKQDRKDKVSKKKKKQQGKAGQVDLTPEEAGQVDLTPEEAAEQAEVMTSQIHLFWGYLLFDRSQIEYFLGLSGWDTNRDAALMRFKLAGFLHVDIVNVISKHYWWKQKEEGKVEEVKVSADVVEKGDD